MRDLLSTWDTSDVDAGAVVLVLFGLLLQVGLIALAVRWGITPVVDRLRNIELLLLEDQEERAIR